MTLIVEQIVAALTPLAPTTSHGRADPINIPRITYQLITGSDNGTLTGAGPQRSRYQIDCYAESALSACGLAVNAKVALRAGLVVGGIFDNPDDYETDTKLNKASFDVAAWATT